MANEGYARYDYAWKTPGWSAQSPAYVANGDGYVEPGLPADVSMVRVYGSFLEWDSGRGLEGVIRVMANRILTHVPTQTQVMPGTKVLRFRPDGFSILLPATDDPQLVPNGWRYRAKLTVHGKAQEFEFELPSTPAEVNVTSLIPTGDEPEEGVEYFFDGGTL